MQLQVEESYNPSCFYPAKVNNKASAGLMNELHASLVPDRPLKEQLKKRLTYVFEGENTDEQEK